MNTVPQEILDFINFDDSGEFTEYEYFLAKEVDYLRRVHKADLENIQRLCSESRRRKNVLIDMRTILKEIVETQKIDEERINRLVKFMDWWSDGPHLSDKF